MAGFDHLFQKLILEATAACGPDMAAIEGYVADRIGRLDALEHGQLKREIEAAIAPRAPGFCEDGNPQ